MQAPPSPGARPWKLQSQTSPPSHRNEADKAGLDPTKKKSKKKLLILAMLDPKLCKTEVSWVAPCLERAGTWLEGVVGKETRRGVLVFW